MPHHHRVPFRSQNVLSVLFHLLLNPITFGFYVSLLTHEDGRCSWQNEEEEETPTPTIFTYFWGTYLTLHVFTWFVVFTYLYQHVIDVGIHYLLSYFQLGCQQEAMFAFIFEVLFGYWACAEILGGWCDLEQIKDCIQDNNHECDSFAIRMLTRAVQSLCERLTLSYDPSTDAYITGKKSQMCAYLFRYSGHFIMSLISTLFTIMVVCY